jgi:hypothetical protein
MRFTLLANTDPVVDGPAAFPAPQRVVRVVRVATPASWHSSVPGTWGKAR